MNRITIISLITLIAFSSVAADSTNVTLVIDGKFVALSDTVRPQIIQRSVDLLASSAYKNENPNWGAPAEPQTILDAKKESHLHLNFSVPRKIEIPILDTVVKAQEIVITLPLTRAGIWVQTDDGVKYFAKFKPIAADNLQKSLDNVLPPR